MRLQHASLLLLLAAAGGSLVCWRAPTVAAAAAAAAGQPPYMAGAAFFEAFGPGWEQRWTYSAVKKYRGRFTTVKPLGYQDPAIQVGRVACARECLSAVLRRQHSNLQGRQACAGHSSSCRPCSCTTAPMLPPCTYAPGHCTRASKPASVSLRPRAAHTRSLTMPTPTPHKHARNNPQTRCQRQTSTTGCPPCCRPPYR
jgi:hypothetical protein